MRASASEVCSHRRTGNDVDAATCGRRSSSIRRVIDRVALRGRLQRALAQHRQPGRLEVGHHPLELGAGAVVGDRLAHPGEAGPLGADRPPPTDSPSRPSRTYQPDPSGRLLMAYTSVLYGVLSFEKRVSRVGPDTRSSPNSSITSSMRSSNGRRTASS